MIQNDIAPELLEKLLYKFKEKTKKHERLRALDEMLKSKTATYKEANEYSIIVGELLAEVFKENLSSESLPDKKMYFNIAERILNGTMEENYNLVSNYSTEVQEALNSTAGMGLKAVKPPLNQDRVDGIVVRVSSAEDFDDIKWILDEPIIIFSQSIVDECIKLNVEFHNDMGLSPKIIRREAGGCCDWCRELVGEYEYPDVPDDIYRRHRYCRCTVDYYPGDGRRQNVHSKKWR